MRQNPIIDEEPSELSNDHEKNLTCMMTGHLWVKIFDRPGWIVCVRCEEERKIDMTPTKGGEKR